MSMTIGVKEGDALVFQADVLALKYAQVNYGVDAAVHAALSRLNRTPKMPAVGQSVICDGSPAVAASRILFIGVPPINDFSYSHIRDFGRLVIETVAKELTEARRLALTLHGPGFGLDETESFESELAGVMDGIHSSKYPSRLTTITFVERDKRRASRLKNVLAELRFDQSSSTRPKAEIVTVDSLLEATPQTTLRSVGYASSAKPRVFVAMPFAAEMDDTFHYGIQGATNAAGMLCERADLSAFTGDVMEWVKVRIASARLVVADLSTSNPNVYLEVGYAWGKNVPTVLLAKDSSDLKFDVKTQRCIVYKSIKHLEESLARELKALV